MAVRPAYEDTRVLAFHHPEPVADVHVVVIPKAHVPSILHPKALDGELLAAMVRAVQHVAGQLHLDEKGFYLRANASAPGVAPHMRWLVLGPGVPPMKQA